MAAKQKENESVEDILSQIKSVISGNNIDINPSEEQDNIPDILDEDIMELTEVVEVEDEPEEFMAEQNSSDEGNIQENIIEKQLDDEDDDEFVDVLKEIDDSINNSDKKNEKETVKEEVIMADENNNAEEEILDLDAMLEGGDEADAADDVMDLDAMLESEEELVVEEVMEEIAEVESPVVEEAAEQEIEIVEEPVAEEAPKANAKDNSVISSESAAKTSNAIKELMNSIPKPKIESPEFRSGTTLEDVVRESITPLLKEWLDENLETVVKDIVQKEIKKILPSE